MNKLTSPYKVIIVDDEEYLLEFIAEDLQNYGLDVSAFNCPKDVLAYFEKLDEAQKKQHILITDFKMPELSGVELIKELREKGTAIVSSVLLTGLINQDDLREANSMENLEIMEKPVDLKRLVIHIRDTEVLS